MANAGDRNAVIRENLRDAGMNSAGIDSCMRLLDMKDYAALERYLAGYRRELLEMIHSETARLDCLDYFTYTLKKNGGI